MTIALPPTNIEAARQKESTMVNKRTTRCRC